MITTHVLDTARGCPAAGVPVRLELQDRDGWRLVGEGTTDADGRLGRLTGGPPAPGVYRLRFDVAAYLGADAFYPWVEVAFAVREPSHHHVPLLLSPFGYSTYRGS